MKSPRRCHSDLYGTLALSCAATIRKRPGTAVDVAFSREFLRSLDPQVGGYRLEQGLQLLTEDTITCGSVELEGDEGDDRDEWLAIVSLEEAARTRAAALDIRNLEPRLEAFVRLLVAEGRYDARARALLRAFVGFLPAGASLTWARVLRWEQELLCPSPQTLLPRAQHRGLGRIWAAGAASMAFVFGGIMGGAALWASSSVASVSSITSLSFSQMWALAASSTPELWSSMASIQLFTATSRNLLFAAAGGGLTALKAANRFTGIREFWLRPLHDRPSEPTLRPGLDRTFGGPRKGGPVMICVPGWFTAGQELGAEFGGHTVCDRPGSSSSLLSSWLDLAPTPGKRQGGGRGKASAPTAVTVNDVDLNVILNSADHADNEDTAAEVKAPDAGPANGSSASNSTAVSATQSDGSWQRVSWGAADWWTKSVSSLGEKHLVVWDQIPLQQLEQRVRNLVRETLMEQGRDMALEGFFKVIAPTVTLPLFVLEKVASIGDPWATAVRRSQEAGRLLAESLLERAKTSPTPVTLIAYSLGARVVYHCLQHLASKRRSFARAEKHTSKGKGGSNLCIVENCVLLGCPVSASAGDWGKVRQVVAGRLVNGFSRHDWILAGLHRLKSLELGPTAGTTEVQVEGVENLDLTQWLHHHVDYPSLLPQVLEQLDVEGTRTRGPVTSGR